MEPSISTFQHFRFKFPSVSRRVCPSVVHFHMKVKFWEKKYIPLASMQTTILHTLTAARMFTLLRSSRTAFIQGLTKMLRRWSGDIRPILPCKKKRRISIWKLPNTCREKLDFEFSYVIWKKKKKTVRKNFPIDILILFFIKFRANWRVCKCVFDEIYL